jgi:hypothetical protein
MSRVLLIDHDQSHAQRLKDRLRHLSLIHFANIRNGIGELCRTRFDFDIVILNVSARQRNWQAGVRALQHAFSTSLCRVRPSVLCISTIKNEPQFELEVERLGARYVYDPEN